jgi:hypothetical protein
MLARLWRLYLKHVLFYLRLGGPITLDQRRLSLVILLQLHPIAKIALAGVNLAYEVSPNII